jgi:hypothetical protein
MRLSSSTKAKVAAALLTVSAPMLGSFSASAQQVASAQPDFSACDELAESAPAKATQCRIDALRAHTSSVRRETVELERDGQCARDLKALREKDPTIVDRGRAILAGRPAAQFGVCNLLAALNNS